MTFGGPAFGGEDLAPVRRSIRLEGSAEGSFAGTGVGCADVNGDGVDDVLVGAWAYEYPGRPAGTAASRGRAYVVFGGAALRSEPTIDLGALGARGFVIVGPDTPEYDHLGYAVTRIGDLNGDGREEIAVMANTGDTTGPHQQRHRLGRARPDRRRVRRRQQSGRRRWPGSTAPRPVRASPRSVR